MSVQAAQLLAEVKVDGVESGQSKLSSMAQTIEGSRSVFGTLAMAGVAAAGVLIGVGVKATQMAADYQQSMLKVQALTGASNEQMSSFDKGIKQLSMDTGTAPKQLSEGLYNVISAGYQGKDAMTVLALATKDATIGMTSAKVTTDALTNVMASFGKQAKDATGVNGEMLETVTLGKSTFEQYANSIVKSASSASQFHESMETMNAAFATMTSSGIKAAQASTDFQASLKVMDGNIGAVAKSLDKSGIAFDEAKFNTMDYGHKVVYLNTALDEANKKHVHITGVTLQAAQAISTISQHIGTYNTDLTTLSDKQAMAQKTQEAWAVTQEGFNVSMQRLKATFSVFMIDLGQKLLPIATGAVNALNTALGGIGPMFIYVGNVLKSLNLTEFNLAWTDLKSVVRDTAQTFQMLGEKLVPIKTDFDPIANAIAGLAKGGLSILTDMMWKAYEGISAFNVAFHGGKGPVTDFANGMKELGPPLQNIGNLFKGELGKEFKDFGDDAKQVGGFFMSSVVPALKQAAPGFESLGKTVLTTIIPAMIQIRGVVQDVVQHAFKDFAPIVEKIIPPLIVLGGIVAGQVSEAIKFLTPYVLQAAKAIGSFADDIMDRVAPIIRNVINGITPILNALFTYWKVVWPGMSMVLQGVFEMIVGVVKIAWALITGIFKISLDILSGNWKQAWVDMKDMLKGVWDGIKTYVSGGVKAMEGLLTTVGSIVYTYLVQPFLNGLGTIGGVFLAIGNLIRDASGFNWGAIPGDLHALRIPGFASGTNYAPGGLGIVGEQGPELMYIPRGAQITPNSQLTGASSGGSNQPIIINVHVAGHNVAQVLLPDITNAVRYGVGGLGF